MNRRLCLGLVVFVALVSMTLAGSVQTADAGWGHYRGWYGGWYGYGYGGGYGGGCCAPVVYQTSWRGYAGRGCGCGWRSHRWAGRGWRSWYSGCCYDPCSVSCCYDPCDTCGYSVDSCGCGGGETWDTTYQEVPTEAQPEVNGEPTPAEPEASVQQSAFINVRVPAEAKVYVNGRQTTSDGQFRQYVSHGLKRDSQYRYMLRAEVVRDGQTVTRTQMVAVSAGQRRNVAFDFNSQDTVAAQPVETNLKVRVPENAKVYLSGKKTRSTGSLREFTTTQLSAGEQWQKYTIRVESELDGQPVVQTRVVTLIGGQPQEVAFDFDGPQLAAR